MRTTELRKLDAWIAEHVMGFEKCPMPDETGWKIGGTYLPGFSPTTDRSESMLVLERCIARAGWTRIIGLGSTVDGGFFINHFEADPESEAFCTTEAETLPLLICQFAKQLFTP